MKMRFCYGQSEVICVPSGEGRDVNVRHHDAAPRLPKGFISAVNLSFLILGIVGVSFAQQRPLLEYRFEEGSGSFVANSGTGPMAVGTLGDGSSTGGGPQFFRVVPQSIGSGFSLHFDGANDVVTIPDAFNYTVDGQPSTAPLSQLTIEAWIKPEIVGGGLRRVIWDDYGNPGIFLGLWDDSVQFTISTPIIRESASPLTRERLRQVCGSM
jgi:hypothetical protein